VKGNFSLSTGATVEVPIPSSLLVEQIPEAKEELRRVVQQKDAIWTFASRLAPLQAPPAFPRHMPLAGAVEVELEGPAAAQFATFSQGMRAAARPDISEEPRQAQVSGGGGSHTKTQ